MVAQFDEAGIHFKYPENWRLDREETEAGWTWLLQSPETAFLLLSLREDLPKPEDLAKTALAVLREDYPGLEADDCVTTLAGRPAVGHDIRFFSLDLTNTCWTRSFLSPGGTVLVMCQINDLEWERSGLVLQAICASLRVDAT